MEMGKRELYNIAIIIVGQLCGYPESNREIILAKVKEILKTMPFERTT